jgi:hypothetical protein
MSSTADPVRNAVVGDRLEDYDGLRLLLSDIRVAGKLLNEARRHTVTRLFGVRDEDSVLVSMVAIGALAAAGHQTAVKAMRGPPLPEFGSTMITGAGVDNLIRGVGGEASRAIPNFGTLVVLAVLASSARPVTRRTLHEVHAVTHAMRMGFDHRYGHIFRPHRRAT